MTDRNYALLVGAYDAEAAAKEDFAAIKEMDDVSVVAAVVLSRDADGKVEVKEHGGRLVKRGTAIGAVSGLVVGLFAPAVAAVGRGGSRYRRRRGSHREAQRGEEDRRGGGGVASCRGLGDRGGGGRPVPRPRRGRHRTGDKKISKAIDKGDYDAVVKAVNEGDEKIIEAIDS